MNVWRDVAHDFFRLAPPVLFFVGMTLVLEDAARRVENRHVAVAIFACGFLGLMFVACEYLIRIVGV